MTTTAKSKKSTTLIGLFIAFSLPITLSWLLYNNHAKNPTHIASNAPTIDVKNLLLAESGTDKWQMVYIAKEQCGSNCEQVAYTLQQIKKALGKDGERVTIKQTSLDAAGLTTQENVLSYENKIYLVDPSGKVFMYYTDTSNPMSILKDLKHELEVAQIG